MIRNLVFFLTLSGFLFFGFLAVPTEVGAGIGRIDVGRITSIDQKTHTVLLRGVSLSEDQVGSTVRDSTVLIRDVTRIVYNGSAITFSELKLGDFIRVSGAMSGDLLVAGEIQRYGSARTGRVAS